MNQKIVPVLYARRDSIYKKLPGFDVYDEDRDARTFKGNEPVIAHPPCATWGRMSQWSTQNTHDLGFHALSVVERNGGVIEHPAGTKLYRHVTPGKGFILSVNQAWFGHLAQKRTHLYIVGVGPGKVPKYPLSLDRPEKSIERMSKSDREHTPLLFALWLQELVRSIP